LKNTTGGDIVEDVKAQFSPSAGIEICGGHFVLSVSGDGRTVLSPKVPVGVKGRIVVDGAYHSWRAGQWRFLRDLAKTYYGEHVEKELERIEEEMRAKKVAEELPIVEDPAPPRFWAAHTLELHVSRGNYIRIAGRTFPHRQELRQLGFVWDARLKVWEAQFSEELFKKAVEFVREHDQRTDPIRAGMVQCEHCGRWTAGFQKEKLAQKQEALSCPRCGSDLVVTYATCYDCGFNRPYSPGKEAVD
jgi:hypothetical protein